MYPYTHVVVGATIGATLFQQWRLWLLAALGALLPDLGMLSHQIYLKSNGLGWYLWPSSPIWIYTDITHSLVVWCVLLVASARLPKVNASNIAFAIGATSHAVIDVLTHGRNPSKMMTGYLWPFDYNLAVQLGIWQYHPGRFTILAKPPELVMLLTCCGLLALIIRHKLKAQA